MFNILRELYYGRVPQEEIPINRTTEEKEIQNKIQEEKKYFSTIMSAEDYKRFENLEKLYGDFTEFEDIRTFIRAFRLGAMIMHSVFMEDGKEKNNNCTGEEEAQEDEF